jgi:AbiTii-like protein
MHMPFPDKIATELNKNNGEGWRYDLVIATSELVRIIDQVRSLVLDWALNLQKAGIMGSEVSFNDAEKEKAQAASTTIHIGSIGTMAGNIGQGNNSGNNTIKMEQVQSILDRLKPHVSTLSAEGAGKALSERIAALEQAIKQKEPDISAIRGFIIDLRNTLTGAAGNLIASGALSALNVILGTGVPA